MIVPRQQFTDLNQIPLSLQIGSFNSEILSWGFFEPCRWRNYLHVHSFFEVCYAFAGGGIFRTRNTDYEIHTGEVFIAGPGDIHEIISSDEEPLGIYFWSHTLTLQRNCNGNIKDIDSIFHAFLTFQRPVSAHTPTMLRTLDLLTEEVVRREPGYMQAIEGLAIKLLLDTARAVVDSTVEHSAPPARNPEEAIVQIIIRYLQDNYKRPITIRDLAAQVHLSERHTSRLFHKITDTSIMDYLTALRMETATQLLLEQQLSIKEVAQESGYPDVRYFTTLFRHRTGLTPAVFKQKRGTRFIH